MLDPQVTGYRRDQDEGGGAGPSSYRVHGPGEIKRRDVVLDPQVTGYRIQARARGGRWCWTLKLQGPGEIKRREVVLDPQASPKEIMNRDVELGCESWTFFA